MTRLAYVSRSAVGHDLRFTSAWRDAGLDVHALVEPARPAAAADRQRLADALRDLAPDLVHVGPLTDPGWDVVEAFDGPVIATSWGFDLMDEVQSDAGARERAAQVLRTSSLIFVDNDGPARVAAELGADPARIRQFPWGVDGHWLERPAVTEHRPAGQSVLLCTRRHDAFYRVGDVVTAFAAIAPEHPGVRLILAGSGPLTGELRASAAALGFADRVEFAGDIANDALPALMRDADVYLSASSVDGTSVSLLEAMASGPAVVVSDIEGNRQWVDDETGWRFGVGDADDLARVLRGVLDAPAAERIERSAAARRRVEERADWRVSRTRFAGYAAEAIATGGRR